MSTVGRRVVGVAGMGAVLGREIAMLHWQILWCLGLQLFALEQPSVMVAHTFVIEILPQKVRMVVQKQMASV